MSEAAHPLDAPVWQALTTRHAGLARGSGGARRSDPGYGLFAAVAVHDPEHHAGLADLVAPGETIGLFERTPPAALPGFERTQTAHCVQMIATDPPPATTDASPLGEADAAEMLALAGLTRPGPFFRRTHRFGGFLGIRIDGRLAAMAGTRLALPGYREVSGVCTHPDFRGRGLAAGLIAAVAGAIHAEGDTPFLTSYADNAGAIALYRRLGFVPREEIVLSLFERH